ncbi:MAG: sensor histidine kinase [Bacillota bacterium]
MTTTQLDIALLDRIVKETVETVESSKNSIFDLAETAKREYKRVIEEIEDLRVEIFNTMDKIEDLETKYKRARIRLMEVSSDFNNYKEADIKEAYEMAYNYQTMLAVEREKEKNLRAKRDENERNMYKLQELSKKAEGLVTQVDLAVNFINGNLVDFSHQIEGIQQNQQISSKIIKAQEEERKRVAREIHDGPAQNMANVVMHTELCEKLLETKPEAVKSELQQLKIIVKKSLDEIRKLIFNLRPMALDDLGLLPTLYRFAEEILDRENLPVEIKVIGTERRLPSTTEVALFRLIQEAINNARRHAEAESVQVRVEFGARELRVTIMDNGKGFDLSKVKREAEGKESFGIMSMQERVKLLNGEFNLDSSPGAGTRVLVVIPMEIELGGKTDGSDPGLACG